MVLYDVFAEFWAQTMKAPTTNAVHPTDATPAVQRSPTSCGDAHPAGESIMIDPPDDLLRKFEVMTQIPSPCMPLESSGDAHPTAATMTLPPCVPHPGYRELWDPSPVASSWPRSVPKQTCWTSALGDDRDLSKARPKRQPTGPPPDLD